MLLLDHVHHVVHLADARRVFGEECLKALGHDKDLHVTPSEFPSEVFFVNRLSLLRH